MLQEILLVDRGRFPQSRHFVSKLVHVIPRRHVDPRCTIQNVRRFLQTQKCRPFRGRRRETKLRNWKLECETSNKQKTIDQF